MFKRRTSSDSVEVNPSTPRHPLAPNPAAEANAILREMREARARLTPLERAELQSAKFTPGQTPSVGFNPNGWAGIE
jgi:hypothetical protein